MASDPWHFLVRRTQLKREGTRRHNAVVDALYHAVLATGGQASREVKGLQADSHLRPDLQLLYPGEHVITDVAVVHPLGAQGKQRPLRQTHLAKATQELERLKYAAIGCRHDAQLIPFVVETCGGLAPDAITLLDVISGAASEHLFLSGRREIRPSTCWTPWPS